MKSVCSVSMVGCAMPLLTAIESPVLSGDPLQVPLAAALICACTFGGVGCCVGSRLAQAAVLLHGGARQPAPFPWLLLVMNVMVAPHPCDVFPWKGQSPTAIGKRHASGGTVCGGFAVATAEAAMFIWNRPQ